MGAEPVFVDIDPRTYTLDPNQVETSIRAHDRGRSGPRAGRIRAIVPVHLYGHPADMDALTDIARRYELKVVEDAAQAHGAEWNGQRCGSVGDLASFSFHPTKNLGAYGDGGMVTGNDKVCSPASADFATMDARRSTSMTRSVRLTDWTRYRSPFSV